MNKKIAVEWVVSMRAGIGSAPMEIRAIGSEAR